MPCAILIWFFLIYFTKLYLASVMKCGLLIIHFSPVCCHVVPSRSKYLLQEPSLECHQCVFFRACERPSFTPIQITCKIVVLYFRLYLLRLWMGRQKILDQIIGGICWIYFALNFVNACIGELLVLFPNICIASVLELQTNKQMETLDIQQFCVHHICQLYSFQETKCVLGVCHKVSI
jgi:hypothetical protein